MGAYDPNASELGDGMASAFGVEHGVDATAARLFKGWKENVYVGNAELVPLSKVVNTPTKAADLPAGRQ